MLIIKKLHYILRMFAYYRMNVIELNLQLHTNVTSVWFNALSGYRAQVVDYYVYTAIVIPKRGYTQLAAEES